MSPTSEFDQAPLVCYRRAMQDQSITQYDDFAPDYHWLYSDSGLTGEPAIEENEDVLRPIGQEMWILDCSCGIGTLALALARRGFKVIGADGSRGMIKQAVSAAARTGLNVPLICSTWEELPEHFGDQFELVLCLGNSIGHCQSKDVMIRSLRGMRRVLRDSGKLVIQSRNWEYLRRENKRVTCFQWRERDGKRCLPIYVWSFPESFGAKHSIEVLLVFDTHGQTSIRSYTIAYYPFRFEQLADCLRSAGFVTLQSNPDQNNEWCRVIAS